MDRVVDNPLYEPGTIGDRYGTEEGTEYTNPLFDADTEQETAETEAPAEQETAETEAPVDNAVRAPLPNLLENIGGLPTVTSIQNMAPGIKLEKENLNKSFSNALSALEEYQTLVTKQHMISVNDAEMRRTGKYFNPKVNLYAEAMSEEKLTEAEKVYLKLADFIHWTEKAVYGWKGLFTRRSDNLKRLTPVFANMLTQAYSLLPKVAHLESAVPPYLMATDQETYNFSDVIDHAVTAGRSGGLAMHGYENENSDAIMLSPKEASKTAQNARKAGKLKQDGEDADIYENIMEHRRNATREARMNLKIPTLPMGYTGQKAVEQVDSYLADLRKLMTALEDTAESAEFSVMDDERLGVHDQQALNFRLARLIYLVMQHRDTLEAIVTNVPNVSHMPGYEEINSLGGMRGQTLSEAVASLNEIAMNEANYARLEDENGKELQVDKDYKVGGGSASVAILDRKNKRVLRAPQGFTKEKQKTALNGIKDEASGVVSRFLGFNVCAQAKAGGFVARDDKGNNPTPVFGGSVMEMADGVEADSINLLMGLESQEFLQEHRKNDKYRNLDVMKQGRLIGEIMKMNVLDYIIMHDDRHTKNFLVNLDADETEAMVTGIDNDYVLGSNNSRQAGNKKSAHALAAINDRIVMDNGVKLETGFPMMTQEVKETLQNLDPAALNHLLMPYADRVMRMAAVHRAAELKKYAETVETCDLTTPEGTEQFIKKAVRSSMKEWLRGSTLQDTYFNARDATNTVVRMLIDAVFTGEGARGFIDAEKMVEVMKYLGISNSEAENIMLENLSSSSTADVKITREELMASKIGKALAEY
ncbi:MAG: hypothetical protein ACI4HQ_11630 [Acetatifactor sp.]